MPMTDSQLSQALSLAILNMPSSGVPVTAGSAPPGTYAPRIRSIGSVTVSDGTRMAVALEYNLASAAATAGWLPLLNGAQNFEGFSASPSLGSHPGHVSMLYVNAQDPGGAAALARLRAICSNALQAVGVPLASIAQV